MIELFARPPAAARLRLAGEPVLESWNAAGHPDQLRLRTYVDTVAEQVRVNDWPPQGQYSVELVVGLADPVPLHHGGRDLDNYLYPLARRLGPHRIAAAFGRKVRQAGSTIAVGTALPAGEPGTPQLLVRTSVSSASSAWKRAIHDGCLAAAARPLPPGPVALRIHFSVSRLRNWSALWKPAIDALGPMLGIPDPARPFRPDDDRIVDLELHRLIDDGLGHDVVIRAWWHSAADQPA
ncbi:hypothetical protein [Actinoplanes sp. NPDC026623]|uniref:hypothetical protein n=1 Tax=Actinoplanes sp. NPDC026623 TaxID=3155610 RepID=UPI0033CDBEF6